MPRGKKRKDAGAPAGKPFCYYCDREFGTETQVLQHQKAKHFRCPYCRRHFHSAPSICGHVEQVHGGKFEAVPEAIQGREDPKEDIQGMKGVPLIDENVAKRFKAAMGEPVASTASIAAAPPGMAIHSQMMNPLPQQQHMMAVPMHMPMNIGMQQQPTPMMMPPHIGMMPLPQNFQVNTMMPTPPQAQMQPGEQKQPMWKEHPSASSTTKFSLPSLNPSEGKMKGGSSSSALAEGEGQNENEVHDVEGLVYKYEMISMEERRAALPRYSV